MAVHRVFCHLLFSPKIWGLRFPSMIACMLSLIMGFVLTGGVGIVAKFLLTLLLTGFVYAGLYWMDNRDKVVFHARRHCRIKRVAAAYTLPNLYLRLE